MAVDSPIEMEVKRSNLAASKNDLHEHEWVSEMDVTPLRTIFQVFDDVIEVKTEVMLLFYVYHSGETKEHRYGCWQTRKQKTGQSGIRTHWFRLPLHRAQYLPWLPRRDYLYPRGNTVGLLVWGTAMWRVASLGYARHLWLCVSVIPVDFTSYQCPDLVICNLGETEKTICVIRVIVTCQIYMLNQIFLSWYRQSCFQDVN